MNLASLSSSYLRARPLNTALSLMLLALGVATIVLLVLVVSQLEERMSRDARGIDLVVGAKGSPMQLILAGIYHADAPTGNIPLAAVQAFQKNRLVRKVIPLALGDGWKGFRIVGAGHEYLEHYGAKPAIGRLWDEPMEVVLGAEVAARTGVGVGARFAGAHGITGQGEEHGAAPYDVVGVLGRTGSVLDRLVLTSVESVWQVHEQEHGPEDKADRKALEEDREVTVLLLQYASPLAAAMLPRQINSQSELQAASPAYETARLFRIVGVGVEAMRAFAIVLIIAAGLSVFIALYTALEERRYDLAVMRTLGAAPGRLFGLLIMEGVVLAALGTLIGLALGHALAATLGAWLESQQQYPVTGLAWRAEELWLAAVALGVGLIAALLPAWRAYRTDVSRTLARG
ncbi:MAG: multidrug ABC transporter substrate-binding protein [Betaproteobacteria bacterium RIFCSPLOWO2_12_FULL_68_19]|nr:MAG: multidrug ABC transporter substrate-binding protein [Betaproteobacteria bacterium RIFCSPLOWO2_12_FULL_68_19]